MTIPQMIVASLAAFLIGANISFLVEFRGGLVDWWKFKISAVTTLLIYILFSMIAGNPGPWRVCVGAVACLIDVVAGAFMYIQIKRASVEHTPIYIYNPRGNND